MTGVIMVGDHDPLWAEQFEELRRRLVPHLADLAVRIEHVGSTAVPGCAAKPIIDLDIVVAEATAVPEVISRLSGLGYRHEGDLGIPGREAFQAPPGTPVHHLYCVVAGTKPHLDHIVLRDYLRQRPDEVRRYSALKVALAREFRADGDGRRRYATAKSALVEELAASAYAARAGGHAASGPARPHRSGGARRRRESA